MDWGPNHCTPPRLFGQRVGSEGRRGQICLLPAWRWGSLELPLRPPPIPWYAPPPPSALSRPRVGVGQPGEGSLLVPNKAGPAHLLPVVCGWWRLVSQHGQWTPGPWGFQTRCGGQGEPSPSWSSGLPGLDATPPCGHLHLSHLVPTEGSCMEQDPALARREVDSQDTPPACFARGPCRGQAPTVGLSVMVQRGR